MCYAGQVVFDETRCIVDGAAINVADTNNDLQRVAEGVLRDD